MATNKIPTMLRLPEELYGKMKALSVLEHRSMNMEIEHALAKYILQYEKENGEISISATKE